MSERVSLGGVRDWWMKKALKGLGLELNFNPNDLAIIFLLVENHLIHQFHPKLDSLSNKAVSLR